MIADKKAVAKDDSDICFCFCCKVTPRKGAFFAGLIYLVLGSFFILPIVLCAVLDPRKLNEESNTTLMSSVAVASNISFTTPISARDDTLMDVWMVFIYGCSGLESALTFLAGMLLIGASICNNGRFYIAYMVSALLMFLNWIVLIIMLILYMRYISHFERYGGPLAAYIGVTIFAFGFVALYIWITYIAFKAAKVARANEKKRRIAKKP